MAIWPAAGGFFGEFSNKKHVFCTAKHGEITLQQIWNLPRCWSAHERGLGSYLRNLVLCYFNEHFENEISNFSPQLNSNIFYIKKLIWLPILLPQTSGWPASLWRLVVLGAGTGLPAPFPSDLKCNGCQHFGDS